MRTAQAPAADAPADVLAAGFAQHVERWALARGAGAQTARHAAAAARAVSLATSDGHVCLTLQQLVDITAAPADRGALPSPASASGGAPSPTTASAWRAALLASRVVGTPGQPATMPLILDADDRLYLHRYFDFERRLARRLRAAIAPDAKATGATSGAAGSRSVGHVAGDDIVGDYITDNDITDDDIRLLDRLFGTPAPWTATAGSATPDWQRVAAALALRQRLLIVSGGPGTGKTTAVANLLAGLLRRDPDCRIALTAPTGKAAARLTGTLRQRAEQLPPVLRERLPRESFTVHRLLGARGGGRFAHDAANPLAIDALVVDEASMLDLALATRLLEAVPPHAHVILLGDRHQLSAVESGAVFAELCADPSLSDAARHDLARLCRVPADALVAPGTAAGSASHRTLPDSVVWLTRNFRFGADSGIGRLAADINAGRTETAMAWLRAGDDAAVRWLEDDAAAPVPGFASAPGDESVAGAGAAADERPATAPPGAAHPSVQPSKAAPRVSRRHEPAPGQLSLFDLPADGAAIGEASGAETAADGSAASRDHPIAPSATAAADAPSRTAIPASATRDATPEQAPWRAAQQGYAAYLDTVREHPRDAGAVTQAFERFRVLCAVRHGPRGAIALNQQLERWARRGSVGVAEAATPDATDAADATHHADVAPVRTRSPWYAGRPVMVLRNDPVLRLFNGDVGICLPWAPEDGETAPGAAGGPMPVPVDGEPGAFATDIAHGAGDSPQAGGASGNDGEIGSEGTAVEPGDDAPRDAGLRVYFPDGAGGFRALPPQRLPEHETAFAITVHKAQGSEFDAVLVLLPQRRARVLTRELLYTAVTRARQRVTLCGSAEALAAAIDTPTQRQSGLSVRLREASGGPERSA